MKNKSTKTAPLGQHFLKDQVAINSIIEAGKIEEGETILEIGPGRGILTSKLIESGARVVAVEKDQKLFDFLNAKFNQEIQDHKLILYKKDILDFEPKKEGLAEKEYKLIANIPYYITGQIIRQALSSWPTPKKVVLLLQKEVAERIIARNRKESLLSISVKIFGKPKIVKIVKAGAFNPPPKVDSAILTIEEISKDVFSDKKSLDLFFDIVKAGFAHKRKFLYSNLKDVLKEPEKNLNKCNISPKIRAEDLKLEEWVCLTKEYLKSVTKNRE
jgi:16S rRNA (adenine1518-N6/adenine1519-N6)-dimethyltransferase